MQTMELATVYTELYFLFHRDPARRFVFPRVSRVPMRSVIRSGEQTTIGDDLRPANTRSGHLTLMTGRRADVIDARPVTWSKMKAWQKGTLQLQPGWPGRRKAAQMRRHHESCLRRDIMFDISSASFCA